MISIIDFESNLIIPIEEAKTLGLKYQIEPRFGIQDGKIELMQSYQYYKDECLTDDEDNYYKNQKDLDEKKPTNSYYFFDRYTGDVNYVQVAREGHLVNLIEFAPKCKHKFSIKESIQSEEPSVNNINAILQQIQDKAENLEKLYDSVKNNTFNEKTNVHVGGGLITTYNDLMLKEDVCIDVLQEELNNGWRIIAVCVQPDQRRPDYILGRFNPQLKVAEKENAER
jgi:hypothetical protein